MSRMTRPPIADHPSSSSVSRARPASRRTFYAGAGAFVIVFCMVAFGPSLIYQAGRNAPLTPLVVAHGLVSSAWLVLFLTQAMLVATRRTSLHRRLGLVGAVLTITVVALGYWATIAGARRGFDLSGDLTPTPNVPTPPLAERAVGMLAPIAGLTTFGALAVAGMWYRHRPAVHKRLMMLALLSLTPVPLIHLAGHLSRSWPGAQGFLFIVVLIASNLIPFSVALHDRISQRRIHPVSLWIPILLIAQVIVTQTVVQPSATWRNISLRLIGLVR